MSECLHALIPAEVNSGTSGIRHNEAGIRCLRCHLRVNYVATLCRWGCNSLNSMLRNRSYCQISEIDILYDHHLWNLSLCANSGTGWIRHRAAGIRFSVSRFDTFLDWNQVQNILLWVPEWDGSVPIPAILKLKPLWTGKQILSLAIPRGINIHRSPDPKSFLTMVFWLKMAS